MTEYINKFSDIEKKYFRRDGSNRKTVCRVVVCVKSTETSKPKTFQTASISCRAHHAEFLALLKITKDLFGYLYLTDKTKITEFDLVIRLNNNPCTTCQSFIKFWIQLVKFNLIPEVAFRFILHFSRFYNEDGEDADVLANLKDWVLKIVGLGVTVFLCPIIVTQMKFTSKKQEKRIIPSDQELVNKYFDLLKILKQFGEFLMAYSDGFQSEDMDPKNFGSEPQTICISSSNVSNQSPYPIQVKK